MGKSNQFYSGTSLNCIWKDRNPDLSVITTHRVPAGKQTNSTLLTTQLVDRPTQLICISIGSTYNEKRQSRVICYNPTKLKQTMNISQHWQCCEMYNNVEIVVCAMFPTIGQSNRRSHQPFPSFRSVSRKNSRIKRLHPIFPQIHYLRRRSISFI